MKKHWIILILLTLSFALSSCSTNSPVNGIFFTKVKSPQGDKVKLTAKSFSKMGKSTCRSILGAVATGDCSVEQAMKEGGIKEVHHVDKNNMRIWFFYERYETLVYGE